MKGVNLYSYASVDDLKAAIDHGARLFRYQALVEPDLAKRLSLPEWSRFIKESYIPKVDSFLPHLGNAKIIFDLHNAPGGGGRVFHDDELMGAFTWTWQEIAERYVGVPEVLGYGLLNEPSGTVKEVNKLMRHGWEVVRSIDSTKVVCVTGPHGNPESFSDIAYIPDQFVWYEVHFYTPMSLTHQGLLGNKVGKSYPSRSFDKRDMLSKLKPMIRFQEKHPTAQVYVGEFSIDSYADGMSRANYIRDCVQMFNRYGWHWTYHCWAEHGAWEPTGGVLQALKDGWT